MVASLTTGTAAVIINDYSYTTSNTVTCNFWVLSVEVRLDCLLPL